MRYTLKDIWETIICRDEESIRAGPEFDGVTDRIKKGIDDERRKDKRDSDGAHGG